MQVVKTLKLRIRDKHGGFLEELSKNVNFVWNYVNDLSYRSIKERSKFLSEYDIHKYTVGCNKELKLHSHSVQGISKEYVIRRKQFKKSKLKWRTSYGSRKSLGWIPFNTNAVKYRNGQLYYNGTFFNFWDSYGLKKEMSFGSGSFNQDSKGNWYINLTVKEESNKIVQEDNPVGVDLGCKSFASFSNGSEPLNLPSSIKVIEARRRKAQSKNKKQQAKSLSMKIANIRKDYLHKESSKLVKKHNKIYVGNIGTKSLIKSNSLTGKSKNQVNSSYHQGWYMFKTMLIQKSLRAEALFKEVDESFSTQRCSCCKTLSGPKGTKGIKVREWKCHNCGSFHDRDENAAKNILFTGLNLVN